MRNRTTGWLTLVLAQVIVLGACGSDVDSPLSPSGDTLRLEDFIASASINGVEGVLREGLSPSESGGPTVDVSGNRVVVNGGSSTLDVVSGGAFTRMFITLAGESLGLASGSSAGLGSYYEVTLGAPTTMANLLLTFPQELPTAGFDAFFSVADEAGNVGPFTRMTFEVIQVGTGDVQVTLSWDADSDVDLHVVDPSGDEVYWANTTVPSGGELDLDSNAGCSIDGVRNENITWPVGSAPAGTYTVRVDYWSSCDVASTDYTVIVNSGGNVEVFTGTFTGPGDRGGAGSGIEIVTFERGGGAPSATRAPSRAPVVGLSSK